MFEHLIFYGACSASSQRTLPCPKVHGNVLPRQSIAFVCIPLAYCTFAPLRMMLTKTIDARLYPAKLLLFGEHVLLLGAKALAAPVPAFGGYWDWSATPDRHHQRLLQFAESEHLRACQSLDTEQFIQDLKAGLYFNSNIPTGYGLGSSGALCAAIYDRYAAQKTTELAALKAIFADMESFFHGNSSGIDPLTSYVGAPVLIEHKTSVQRVEPQVWQDKPPIVFLLDTQLPRRTGPLVSWFLAQQQEAVFADKLHTEYLPVHTEMVESWLMGQNVSFWANLRRVSRFQLENFDPMIPENIRDFWTKNAENQDFVLKICGAGGGGFVLGFAKNAASIQAISKLYPVVMPFPEQA